MKDKHRWTVNGKEAVATRTGISLSPGAGRESQPIVGGTICNEEILRLAGRVEELELCLTRLAAAARSCISAHRRGEGG